MTGILKTPDIAILVVALSFIFILALWSTFKRRGAISSQDYFLSGKYIKTLFFILFCSRSSHSQRMHYIFLYQST